MTHGKQRSENLLHADQSLSHTTKLTSRCAGNCVTKFVSLHVKGACFALYQQRFRKSELLFFFLSTTGQQFSFSNNNNFLRIKNCMATTPYGYSIKSIGLIIRFLFSIRDRYLSHSLCPVLDVLTLVLNISHYTWMCLH